MYASDEDTLVPLGDLYESMPILQQLNWKPRFLASLIRFDLLAGVLDSHTKTYLSSRSAIRRALEYRRMELMHQSQMGKD